MTERMTSICLPGSEYPGWANYGRKSPAEMIEEFRSHARYMRDRAEEILSATDDDFLVKTYRGVHVQRNVEVLQKGIGKP
jgi:hypothetical protein